MTVVTTSTEHDPKWALRVNASSDALVREAAASVGVSVATFVEQSAVVRAEAVLAAHRATDLGLSPWSRFFEALDEAPAAVPELVDLFSRPRCIPEN